MCFLFLVPQRPTDLRVTKVRNLDVTLTWKRPSNIPPDTILLYIVRCATIGRSKSWGLDPLLEESATVQLEPNTQYNIHVKAMRKDDNKIQSAWQSLRVNTSHFGESQVFLALNEKYHLAAVFLVLHLISWVTNISLIFARNFCVNFGFHLLNVFYVEKPRVLSA